MILRSLHGSELPDDLRMGRRSRCVESCGGFYDLVEDDELLGPVFGGTVSEQHRRDVVTWWSEVMGGPAEYTAALGGYEHLAKHRGLHISDDQRLRFVTLLLAARRWIAR